MGFVVLAEERGVRVLRSHDLSEVGEVGDLGGAVCSAALAECGGGSWLELYLGLDNGQVVACTVDVRGAAVAR